MPQKNDVENFFMGPQFYSKQDSQYHVCSEIIPTKTEQKILDSAI